MCVCALTAHPLPPYTTTSLPNSLYGSLSSLLLYHPVMPLPEILLFMCHVYLLTAILPSLDCKSLGQDLSILFTACSQSLEQW